MKACLLYIKLVYPDAPSETCLDAGKTWLLAGISSYKDFELYAFGVPSLSKSPELGRIFSHLGPNTDNTFEVEMGVVLPDLLPNLNDKIDYWVDVVDENAEPHTLCVSNQMVKVSYRRDEEQYHAILPRCHVTKLEEEGSKFGVPEGAPQKLLRTMVTCRFAVVGDDAEDALQNNIDAIVETYISLINRFLAANQMLSEEGAYPALPSSYDRTSFDVLYLIMRGADQNQFGHGRFALNSGKVALNPNSVKGPKADQLVSYLNGAQELDEGHLMMHSAKSALDGGLLRYGLLQTVIAAEMATADFVRRRLLAHGVSRTKWDDYGGDITYSMMLNIHLFALAPAHMKPDRQLLGILNRARDCRNDLMHKGIFTLRRRDLLEMHEATRTYIRYLRLLDQEPDGQQQNSPDED